MKIYLSIILVCMFFSPSIFAEDNLRIIISGETHGALYPCDCPLRPEGGLSRRSSAIKRLSQTKMPTLNVSVGGEVAGGIYDTQRTQHELKRSEITLKAFAKMGIDVMAIGDEEIAYGLNKMKLWAEKENVILLSANIKNTGIKAYHIFKRDGISIGVIGLSTVDAKHTTSTSLKIADPFETLKTLLPTIPKVDKLIILAHTGEAVAKKLSTLIPDDALIVVGHRKTTKGVYAKWNNKTAAMFSYEGKGLHIAEFKKNNWKVKSILLGENVPDDKEITALLPKLPKPKNATLELYIMSQCPYCPEAEEALQRVMKTFKGRINPKFHFVVSMRENKLHALHGEKEIEKSRREIAVARFYPNQFLDYVIRLRKGESEADIFADLNIMPARINGAVSSGEADEFLKEDAFRSRHLGIASTPSIVINGKLLDPPFSETRIASVICSLISPAPTECKNVPKCIVDKDCERKGYIGKCKNADTKKAECEYTKAVEVPLKILVPENPIYDIIPDVTTSLATFLPGLKLEIISITSDEGKALKNELKETRAPLFLPSASIKNAVNFKSLEEAIREIKEHLIFDPDMIGFNTWINRERINGKLDLFVSPLTKQGSEIISFLYSMPPSLFDKSRIKIHYNLYLNKNQEISAREGIAEIEEIARLIGIQREAPNAIKKYIETRNSMLGSSYWDEAAVSAGLQAEDVKKWARAEATIKTMNEDIALLETLELGGALGALARNQELVEIPSRDALRSILQTLADEIKLGDKK